ncbi:hypothetical protein ACM26V_16290 [Salipaludibacillus sp. HK11]|uniref:hypothetical protein n=1 Tax=Salipaludibacillus sp. HK11 TaxID=3394320 RepID=UPI0039FC8F9C
MKTKNIMIILMIGLLFTSAAACNRPNPPEAELNNQAESYTSPHAQGYIQVHPHPHGGENVTKSLFETEAVSYEPTDQQAQSYDKAIETIDEIGAETGYSPLNEQSDAEVEEEQRQLIENVIRDMDEVTPISVTIIDGRAWVNVSYERSLTPEEEEEKKAFILSELDRKNPEYEYEVKIYGQTEDNF